MKCGSCRDTQADAYRKIDPNDDLFSVLKSLNADRVYNPKYVYFCGACIKSAEVKQAQKISDVTDQNANSFTINTTDNSSIDTSKRTDNSSNSSKDEFDVMVESKRVYSATGTPLYVPPKRPNPTIATKPCPKRFKPTQLSKSLSSIAENPEEPQSSKSQSSFAENSRDQNPVLPDVPEQQRSGSVEIEELFMSTPSVEDEPNTDATSDSERGSKTSSNEDGSGMDANVSNSLFVAPEHSGNTLGYRNSSSSRLESTVSPNVLEVTSTSPSRAERSDKRTRRPSTDTSDIESDRKKSNKRQRRQPLRTGKTRVLPTRRASADKSSSESDRSRRGRKGPDTSRRPTSGQTLADRTTNDKYNSRPTTGGSSRTDPRPLTNVTGTTRPIDLTHGNDSDTVSSLDGDISTSAPAVKNPRLRQPPPSAPMPRTVRDYFTNNFTFDVNFAGRLLAG